MENRSKEKRDFGSFFSSNVQELVELPEGEYCPPKIPVPLPEFSETVKFGSEMKQKHFHLDPEWTFLNHGAFGASIKEGMQLCTHWQEYCERQPLRFMDREFLPHLVYVSRRVAQFIDADPSDVVMIPNVTTGVSTVVKSLVKTFKRGDTIYTLNVAYGATKKLLKHVCSECDVGITEAELKFPVPSKDTIIKLVEETLRPSDKLAIFDHILSNFGLILPVKELVDVCHKRGVQVLVDGAHGLGFLPLSMRDIGADYYVSNCYKWFCAPKGSGLLYVAKPLQSSIRPLVISHGFGSGFCGEFSWTGARDYTPILALHAVLDFWHHYDVKKIRSYISETARNGAHILQQSWKTGLLSNEDLFGPMFLVELPSGVLSGRDKHSYDDAELVQDRLHNDFRIEVPVKAIQDRLYVRISAHIYNETADYHVLANAVQRMVLENNL